MSKTSNTYVIGDIHGAHKALVQCLERSNFNKEIDTLISLGDIVDGWDDVYNCVKELISIKNLIPIKGNHDEWFRIYLNTGIHPNEWLNGGYGTLKSYCEKAQKQFYLGSKLSYNLNPFDIPESHIDFFRFRQINYYVDHKKRLFIHGGFNRHLPLKEQKSDVFYWDRDLIMSAMSYQSMKDNNTLMGHGKFKMIEEFTEVFIGHTSTLNWGRDLPINTANIWNLDTGAGFKGKLTIMNVDTKEYWQSDTVQDLYKDQKHRD